MLAARPTPVPGSWGGSRPALSAPQGPSPGPGADLSLCVCQRPGTQGTNVRCAPRALPGAPGGGGTHSSDGRKGSEEPGRSGLDLQPLTSPDTPSAEPGKR